MTFLTESFCIIWCCDFRHDFADEYRDDCGRWDGENSSPDRSRRIFGRPFVTAGWIVVLVTVLVTVLQLLMLSFVLNLSHNS